MKIFFISFLMVCLICPLASAEVELPGIYQKLVPAHQVKKKPGPYDWLAHNAEPGQTFEDFIRLGHPAPDARHNKIYIMLIGDFDPLRAKIVAQTAEFIRVFYGLPVVFMKPLPLEAIAQTARRVHPQTGDHQILSTYIIEDILIPQRPADAYTVIAFTSADLWPGEGWNFVFGQASLEDRVGVWSMFRNGDPAAGEEAYQLALSRTIKVGLHELGHMFGMPHCIAFECLMNGSNHRVEMDSRPIYLCPVDLRKLIHVIKRDPAERYKALEAISRDFGFPDWADDFARFAEIIQE